MEKLAYVFTNGVSAELVVLFNEPMDEADIECANERVLNEVLIPNDLKSFYFTPEYLSKSGYEQDEDGYFKEMIKVYANDNKEYYLDEDFLIIKYVTEENMITYSDWERLGWCRIIELD